MTSLTGQTGYRGSAGGNQYGGASGGDIIPKGYSKGQMQKYGPESMEIYNQLRGMMGPGSQTARLAAGDEEMFNQMEAPAMRQFNQLQGQNASRFSGMGMGARRGSGFQNYQSQATSDFAQDLQSRRMDLMRQAIQDLRGMGSDLLDRDPTEKFLVEKPQKQKKSGLGGWGGVGGGIVGGVGGFLAGGPAGGLSGAKIGYNVGSAFD